MLSMLPRESHTVISLHAQDKFTSNFISHLHLQTGHSHSTSNSQMCLAYNRELITILPYQAFSHKNPIFWLIIINKDLGSVFLLGDRNCLPASLKACQPGSHPLASQRHMVSAPVRMRACTLTASILWPLVAFQGKRQGSLSECSSKRSAKGLS